MLSPLLVKLLSQYPIPDDRVNEMMKDPPIITLDRATVSGQWTEQMIVGTITENLTIMSTATVLFWKLMRSAQHSLNLYMEMCHPSNVCTDKQLIDAMIAMTYQLVTNLMTSGPRMRLEEGDEAGSEIIVIDPEQYNPADDNTVEKGGHDE